MQIAKEPLLYHLCVAAGKGQRYLSRWGGGEKGGEIRVCSDGVDHASAQSPLCQAPSESS